MPRMDWGCHWRDWGSMMIDKYTQEQRKEYDRGMAYAKKYKSTWPIPWTYWLSAFIWQVYFWGAICLVAHYYNKWGLGKERQMWYNERQQQVTSPMKTTKISVSIQCCEHSCGHCRFKFTGEPKCDLYGWLESSKMGRAGSALRHKKCLEAEVKAWKEISDIIFQEITAPSKIILKPWPQPNGNGIFSTRTVPCFIWDVYTNLWVRVLGLE